MSHGKIISRRVQAISGHFIGRHGTAVRDGGDCLCVCWDDGWEHGIWAFKACLVDSVMPGPTHDDEE